MATNIFANENPRKFGKWTDCEISQPKKLVAIFNENQ